MDLLGLICGERRSIENPQTPLGDDLSWGTWDGLIGPTSSGVRVNRASALTGAAVWRGVNLICGDVAKLGIDVLRRKGKGWEIHNRHPAHKLVSRKPNPYMTCFPFFEALTGHAVLEGNAYAYIFRDNAGRPTDMLPLIPQATYPIRIEGQLYYITSVTQYGTAALVSTGGQALTMMEATELRRIPAEDVLHVKGLGYDGLYGYNVLQYARETFGAAIATRKYRTRFFANNAAPNIVIEYPQQLKPEAIAKLRETWNQIHAGLDNAHKTAILQAGMKLNSFTMDARKAQLLEAEEFEVREVANVLGLPAHKLNDTSNQGYGSREQDDQRYIDECLLKWIKKWEEELTEKLLTEEEKDGDDVRVAFRIRKLNRGDMAARAAYYHGAILDGWMSRDEVRAEEDLDPMPDGMGGKYLLPENMREVEEDTGEDVDELDFKRRIVEAALKDPQALALVDVPGLAEEVGVPITEEPWKEEPKEPEPAEEPPMPKDASKPDEAYRMLGEVAKWRRSRAIYQAKCSVRDAWKRMNKRIALQALTAAKKPDGFPKWLEGMRASNLAVVTEAVVPSERCLSAVMFAKVNTEARIDSYFETMRSALTELSRCLPNELTARVERWAIGIGG